MSARELAGVFDGPAETSTRMVVFTTRARRRDGRSFTARDSVHYFLKSSTRKLPPPLKYLPESYLEDPVVFVSHLPSLLASEFVRPLTRVNYHNAIEASCLIPFAMGEPMQPGELFPIWRGIDPLQADACANDPAWEKIMAPHRFPCDQNAVFLDGGFSLKMPFRIFDGDERFKGLSEFTRCDKTIVFCCDPQGLLWETSMRLRFLNDWDPLRQAIKNRQLFVVYPDHKVEASFLCTSHAKTMRTFERGREQGRRVLGSERFNDFLNMN